MSATSCPFSSASSASSALSSCFSLPTPSCGRRRRRRRPPSAVLLVSLGLLATLRPALAVQIPFENCLPASYALSFPTPLQWVPLYLDAVFDTSSTGVNNLAITVWGNVTGSQAAAPLPPPDSPRWSDPAITDGKILRNPDPNRAQPFATTLITDLHVLNYHPWHAAADFCQGALVNASCPLGPVFELANNRSIPFGLPAVNLSHQFFSPYAFTSFSAVFIVIYGDTQSTTISCVSTTVTPDLGGLAALLRYLPAAILIAVGLATAYAAVCSAHGTTDIFSWTSNYGRHPELLRLVTPGFAECLHYLQFAVLTGGLSLNYPGFYQPVVSQAAWSVLMFNSSLASRLPAWPSVQDGVYVTNSSYGLQRLAQLVGMPAPDDLWVGEIVWIVTVVLSLTLIIQAGFALRWLYRSVRHISEEDLRSKNVPFIAGIVIRIVLVYFSMPLVALSAFQLDISYESPVWLVALAAITLLLILALATRLLFVIATTKPRVNLFDDLQTLLLYGPLYNTYSDEAALYAIVPLLLAITRGVAIGAVQASGVAQLTLLAICEVIQLLTLHAFRPFHGRTWMNAFQTLIASARFIAVLLMITFAPSLGVDEGSRGWVGYAILFIHGSVLVFALLLNALQKSVEVTAYLLGVGGGGGILGARQLSRRMSRRRLAHGRPSRHSGIASTAMLDGDDTATKSSLPAGSDRRAASESSGRIRSESAGSLGGLLSQDTDGNTGNSTSSHSHKRSSSALDSISFDAYSPSSATTPTSAARVQQANATLDNGAVSPLSFLPSTPSTQYQDPFDGGQNSNASYYRPPRQRRTDTLLGPTSNRTSTMERDMRQSYPSANRYSQAIGGGVVLDFAELESGYPSRPAGGLRTDYSTREVDFYYGVRGPALKTDGPGRKLGTGPADPTGPLASASSWLRGLSLLSGRKRRDKVKGFEVVRGARVPPLNFRVAAVAPTSAGVSDTIGPEPASMSTTLADSEHFDGTSVALGVLTHVDLYDSHKQTGYFNDINRYPSSSSPGIPRRSSRRHSHMTDPTPDSPYVALGALPSLYHPARKRTST